MSELSPDPQDVALEKCEDAHAQMSPLAMYQSERSTNKITEHAQDKLDDWLLKNRIRVMTKLPKLDPLTLVSILCCV